MFASMAIDSLLDEKDNLRDAYKRGREQSWLDRLYYRIDSGFNSTSAPQTATLLTFFFVIIILLRIINTTIRTSHFSHLTCLQNICCSA